MGPTEKQIPKGWINTAIKDIADVNAFLVAKNYPYKEIEYIDVASVEERKVPQAQLMKLVEAPSRAKRIVKNKSILISTVRPNLKHYCFIKNAKPNLIASTGFAVIRAKEGKADPYFLYSLLTTKEYTDYLIKIADSQTSTYPAFNPSIIENSKFVIPAFFEQQSIAAVLSSFDDKIELLQKQNMTLENIAQALFKRWFIDFEFPDENGKPYKSSDGKMIDSELGEIPEGWQVKKLGGIVNLTIGRTPPRKESKWFSKDPNDIKWLSIKDLSDSGVFIAKTSEYLTKDAVEKHRMRLVPRNTVVISFKLTVGRVAITLEEMVTNEAIAHLRLLNEIHSEYLFLYFKAFNFNSIGSTSSIATAFNSDSLRNLDVLIPGTDQLRIFENTISPAFRRMAINVKQIQTLSNLRDCILPKLMKGDLRVKEFEM